MQDVKRDWDAAARLSFVSLYGPEDLDVTVYGLDLLASKRVPLVGRWIAVSPYAGGGTYLSRSHEKSPVVDLSDENVLGVQGMVGAIAEISVARLAVEYSLARVSSTTIKVGFAF